MTEHVREEIDAALLAKFDDHPFDRYLTDTDIPELADKEIGAGLAEPLSLSRK